MNDLKNDIGPDEQELLEQFGASFQALRATHASCPQPDILLASQAGVLDGETARNVTTHLEQCGFCRILLRDLTDAELSAARPDEERRVRERVLSAAKASAKAEKAGGGLLASWFWKALPAAALAGVALFAVVWVRLHQPIAPVPTPITGASQPALTAAASVFQWEKLPVKLQADSILVWRGAPRTDQEKYASELTTALAFYRDDNYREAAKQLAKVAQSYPRGVEAQLYLGISLLNLQQNAEAIAPLSAAQKLGPEEFREDATWFLALAYERTHDTQQALAELQKMCQGKGGYAHRACKGIQELSAPLGDTP
ncbi:MAG: tetratricopeptide repeat protein [Terriglobia bacterium]|jgi:tetratricopeptide (TPR) repeat protein